MRPSEMARGIRGIVIERSYRAGVGHIGSSLSVADILAALYADEGGILRISLPDDPDRDRFVLSCGHKALALYAALHLRGWISESEIETFCEPGSRLYSHPNHRVAGVDFSTGSLGMGLGMAAGCAWSARHEGSGRQTYVLVSDAELDEGSTWEAVRFAGHQKLGNLTMIVDSNGQQAMGRTSDVCGANNVGMLRAAGWQVDCVIPREDRLLPHPFVASPRDERPYCLMASTTFGSGVSFMESGGLAWHYKAMDEREYKLALAEVSR